MPTATAVKPEVEISGTLVKMLRPQFYVTPNDDPRGQLRLSPGDVVEIDEDTAARWIRIDIAIPCPPGEAQDYMDQLVTERAEAVEHLALAQQAKNDRMIAEQLHRDALNRIKVAEDKERKVRLGKKRRT